MGGKYSGALLDCMSVSTKSKIGFSLVGCVTKFCIFNWLHIWSMLRTLKSLEIIIYICCLSLGTYLHSLLCVKLNHHVYSRWSLGDSTVHTLISVPLVLHFSGGPTNTQDVGRDNLCSDRPSCLRTYKHTPPPRVSWSLLNKSWSLSSYKWACLFTENHVSLNAIISGSFCFVTKHHYSNLVMLAGLVSCSESRWPVGWGWLGMGSRSNAVMELA